MKSEDERHSELEQLHAALLAATESTRKRKNLKNLWTALEHLRQLGSPDYRIANVARTISNLRLSGPKAQSIRNEEGEHFRVLIDAYAAAYGSERVKETPRDEEIVASITDMRTAARVQKLLADYNSIKFQLDIMKLQFSRMKPVAVLPTGISDEATLVSVPAQLQTTRSVFGQDGILFDQSEISVVREFLDNLRDLDFVRDLASGALLHPKHGWEVAPPGFLQVLEKIISSHGESV